MGRLVLLGPYPAPWGGISVHVSALRRLALHRRLPVEVIDIGESHATRTGADGVRDGGTHLRFVAELARAAVAGARLHAHVPGNNLRAWMVAAAAGRFCPGGLLTVHSGLAPRLLRESAQARRLARIAAAGYGRIFCANGEIADALAGCKIAAERLEVLPAWVAEPDAAGEAPAAARRARARFDLLIAAALAPGAQYGEAVLLEALARLPACGCVVYGPGTDGADFACRVARHGLADRLIALGEIDRSASLGVMRLADLFVRPTLADGDSISVREALALGIRVVASDVGQRPPEARLFPAGDPRRLAAAIERALAEPPPPPPRILDSAARILAAWSSLGLQGGLQ